MAVQIPFPIPSKGFALNSKLRVNLDFLVDKFNEFNTGTATWDTVAIGTANNLTGTLTFYNSSNANFLTIQPGVTGSNITFTLPTDDGDADEFLQTNGSGVLSWQPAIDAGLAGYLAMYDGATLGAASSDLQAFNTQNSNLIRVAIASHAGLGAARTYTIPNAGASASFIMSQGDASITGNLSVVEPNYLRTSVLRLFNAVTVEITLASSGSGHSLVWPSTQGGSNTVLTNNGSGTLSWSTLGAIGGFATTALDNLASVAINTSLISDTDNTDDLGSAAVTWNQTYSTELYLGKSGRAGILTIYPATASRGSLILNAANNAGDTTTIIENASQAGSRTYTIPDAGASASFVMTKGSTTMDGDLNVARTASGDTVDLASVNNANTASSTARIRVSVGGASAADAFHYFDVQGVTDWAQGIDNSDGDAFVTSQNSTLGTNNVERISTAGEITQPLQPSFLAQAAVNTANVTGDGTTFTIEYDSASFDANADFNTTTYTFTAPVTGKYAFTASCLLQGIDSSHSGTCLLILTTSNRNYVLSYNNNTFEAGEGGGLLFVKGTQSQVDMDSGDTAIVTVRVAGGTKTVELFDDPEFNKFSGELSH